MSIILRNYSYIIRRFILLGTIILISVASLSAQRGPDQDYKVLLITKNLTFHHTSVSNGVEMFKDLSKDGWFDLTWTEIVRHHFDDIEQLNTFDVIVFMNTSGNILNDDQKEVFKNYIQNGGNFVGIHGATYTFMDDWPWYAKLVGAWHNQASGNNTAVINVENSNHPSTTHLPAKWIISDEWYNFRQISDNIKVLLTVDEDTYNDNRMGEYHPIAWYQDDFEGASRSFYTVLGHPDEVYANPLYRQHILGGLWWAATGYMLGDQLHIEGQ